MAVQSLTQDLRRCSRCQQIKPADRLNFSFIKCRNKFHPWCKPCCAEDRRRDRAENPERYRAIDAKRDPEKKREQTRLSYWRHRDKRLAETRAKSPEKKTAYKANRRLKIHTDHEYAAKAKAQRDATFQRHGHKYNAQRRDAWKRASAHKKLRTYFTSAICHSLKGSTKGGRSWQTILGYAAQDLREHLERQFLPGMAWHNYGEWHVDHIIPVTAFKFESADDPDFHACWALSNLRPMWAADNIRKSNKRTHLL